MMRFLSLAVIALLALGNQAFAETCGDEAARLAHDYDLQWPQPPVTMESRGMIGTDELAPSQGVIEPPAGDDDMVVDAPETESEMPTAPEIAPPTDEAVDDLTAEQRTRMEALLAEAVKAEKAGESVRCFERLGEAKAIP